MFSADQSLLEAQLAVPEVLSDRLGQKRGTVGLNEESGSALKDNFPWAAAIAGDDRFCGHHGFKQDETKGFGTARKDKDIHGVHPLLDILNMAKEVDCVREAEVVDLVGEMFVEGATSSDIGLGFRLGRPKLMKGLKEDGNVFFCVEACRAENDFF